MSKLARTGLCFVSVLLVQFSSFIAVHAIAQDDPAVDQIAQRAINAQNAGEFKIAGSQWEELISGYPNASQIGVAYYQSGYCFVQTGQFAKAADRLRQAIGKLDPKDKNAIAQAYLFLGFSQAKLGREVREENRQESETWLVNASQTFTKLLNDYPDFEDADQALFFQGDAFESLGRFDEAAKSYSAMLQKKDPEFKLDGLLALGFIRGKQGAFDSALEYYEQFEAVGSEHPKFNEARFLAGEALQQLAVAAENRDDKEQQAALLQRANKKFEAVYNSGDREWADQARFEQASSLHRLGDFAGSARLFQSVVEFAGSKLSDRARVYAGRDFLRAGDANSASLFLEKAVAVPSPHAAEAAHWLAQLYLRSKMNDKAYVLANEWVGKAKEDSVKVPLMLDRADAAYASESRRGEARDLYLEIVKDHPQDRLAATALYNAAYAAMETGKFDDAIKLASQFKRSYEQSDYLPDVLEVEADSSLLADQPKQAEASFNELLQKYSGHPKSSVWKIRSGLAQYLQKQYEQTIATLQPVVEGLEETTMKAEALHWIGSSHYQLGSYKDAIGSLENSLTINNTWRRADETLLTLSRAFYADQNPEHAKKTTQLLIKNFPGSSLIGEANYRMGEFEYQAGNYQQSLDYYVSVIEHSEESQFAPFALYGIGWSQLQLGQRDQSAESFTKLIETFPDHSLAKDVLVGRASALRQSGKVDAAIADAKAYLSSGGDLTKHEEALFELGLAQIAKSEWDGVVSTFEDLLKVAPNSPQGDRYHYELAWAYQSNKDAESSLKHFQQIAEKFPDSSLAAESNFHVAQGAYESEQFEQAAKMFAVCVQKSDYSKLTDEDEIAAVKKIKEKARYKLAWSYFRAGNFDQAQSAFNEQLQEFPSGKFSADAMFMISESLYENSKFKEASERYWVAKPVMEDEATSVSSDYKILTFLHGAQAANQAQEHERAIAFVDALSKLNNVPQNVQQDAQMELGDAYRAKKDPDKAMAAYRAASLHPYKTGARSMFMMGEVFFDQKEFAEAINKFKLVGFGYGGSQSKPEVKPWQAFAAYETGRCNLLLASAEQDSAVKNKYLMEAKKHFKNVVENFPSDKLVPEAKKQLTNLESVQ